MSQSGHQVPAGSPTVFESPDELITGAGRALGATGWAAVEAADVKAFVSATGAPQTDGTVPPLFVLSLTNRFLPDLLEVRGATSGVNYGTGTVRFPAPVRPGERIRVSARLLGAVEVSGGVQSTVEITVEVEGSDEPACVVESLSRWMR